MDPYLEIPVLWSGFHHWLISAASHQLKPKLRPRGYIVNVGERVWVSDSGRNILPDLVVLERPRSPNTNSWTASEEEGDQPVLLKTFEAESREPYLEILDAAGERLVTAVEVLSPVNKAPGSGRDLYVQKQQEVLDSGASLVEIDLLRAGRHSLAVPFILAESLSPHDYLICVTRVGHRSEYEAYPVRLQSRLPRIRVPLNAGEPDVILDLQEAFRYAYDESPAEDRIDYSLPLPGRMSPENLAWCEQIVSARKR